VPVRHEVEYVVHAREKNSVPIYMMVQFCKKVVAGNHTSMDAVMHARTCHASPLRCRIVKF
jgi:hypothetical protein